jgi:thiamine pyrophosphokinase
MNKRAIIFLNGEYAQIEPLVPLTQEVFLVIGVDGGTRHLVDFGLTPQLIIGDMDSIPQPDFDRFKSENVQMLKFPRQKNETDFQLALDQAIQADCREALVFGALGGRSDHLIANLLLPLQYLDKVKTSLFHGSEEITYINNHSTIHGAPGDILSLIPISNDASGVTTTGLLYPLNFETLHIGSPRGVSNELITNKAKVSVTSGVLLCVHTHQ